MSIKQFYFYKNLILIYSIIYLLLSYIFIKFFGIIGIILINNLNIIGRIILNSYLINQYFVDFQTSLNQVELYVIDIKQIDHDVMIE